MYNVVKIPMLVKYDIDEVVNVFDSHKINDIFYYDPDSIFHIELEENGFLEHIPNKNCSFYCACVEIDFNNKIYKYGEQLDINGVPDSILLSLCMLGQIKKEVKSNIEIKFSELAKTLGFDVFKDFKKLVKEKCNIDITHHFNKVSEKEKQIIIKELNGGN